MFETVSEVLREAVAQGAAPGVAAAIGCGSTILYERCFGTLRYEEGSPAVTPETLYDMASVTKAMGATILSLQALGEGKLYLEDPIRQFFPDASADKCDITIRQLLTHTSGIDPHFYLWDYTRGKTSTAEVILNHPLVCTPGTEVRYSCMGFILLGKLLEKVYQAPLDVLFQQRVAQPLGLRHTGYCPSLSLRIAPTEYDADHHLLQGRVHDENARFQDGVSANAGIFSDLKDMEVFVQMLAGKGTLPGGPQVVSPVCLKKAIQNHTPGMAENRGLGFKLCGGSANFMGDLFPDGAFGHTGYTGTSFTVDPDTGLFLILLANRVHPTRNNTLWLRTRRLVHNAVAADFF